MIVVVVVGVVVGRKRRGANCGMEFGVGFCCRETRTLLERASKRPRGFSGIVCWMNCYCPGGFCRVPCAFPVHSLASPKASKCRLQTGFKQEGACSLILYRVELKKSGMHSMFVLRSQAFIVDWQGIRKCKMSSFEPGKRSCIYFQAAFMLVKHSTILSVIPVYFSMIDNTCLAEETKNGAFEGWCMFHQNGLLLE